VTQPTYWVGLLSCVAHAAALVALGVSMAHETPFGLSQLARRTHGPLGPWLVAVVASFGAWVVGARARQHALLSRTVASFRRSSVLVVVALSAFLVTAIALQSATDTYYAVSDRAVIEIDTLHVLRHGWLLGPYSQYSWNHPGPAYFYVLAPLYAASGLKSIALSVTALALNMGCYAFICWVVLTKLPEHVRLPVLVILGLCMLRVQTIFTDTWSPHVLFVPLIAALVGGAAVASGTHWLLLPVCALISFVAQTHVALVPIGTALLVTVVFLAALHARPATETLVPWFNRSAWLLFAMWLPPIADQMASPHGNLIKLFDFFTTNRHDKLGWKNAIGLWGDLINGIFRFDWKIPAGWGVTPQIHYGAVATAVALVFVVAVAARIYWRRGQSAMAALCILSVVACSITLWSLTQIRGMVFDHAIFWIIGVGAVTWSAAAAFIAEQILPRTRLVARAAFVPAIGVGLWILPPKVVGLWNMAAGPSSSPIATVADSAVTALRTTAIGPTLCRIEPDTWGEAAGIILRLYKQRAPIAVETDWLPMFGAPLAPSGQEHATLTFVERRNVSKRTGTVIGCTNTLCAILEQQ
jgi:hypothetical protein